MKSTTLFATLTRKVFPLLVWVTTLTSLVRNNRSRTLVPITMKFSTVVKRSQNLKSKHFSIGHEDCCGVCDELAANVVITRSWTSVSDGGYGVQPWLYQIKEVQLLVEGTVQISTWPSRGDCRDARLKMMPRWCTSPMWTGRPLHAISHFYDGRNITLVALMFVFIHWFLLVSYTFDSLKSCFTPFSFMHSRCYTFIVLK